MDLPSFKEITDKAKNALFRFPITLIWSIAGTAFCIYTIGADSMFDEYAAVLLTLILGVSWLIGTQFFLEQFKDRKKWQWIRLLVLGLLFIFYWHLPDSNGLDDVPSDLNSPEYLTRFFLCLIGGHLFVFFAPFITKWDRSAYWNYLRSVGTAIARSLFFSGVLYLGLVLALAAINALFEVSIPGERYGQLFVFCLGMVNTWIYLYDFPKDILQHRPILFKKPLKVFVEYILIPLVLLYLVILYVYGLKILVQWELPKGWVSYLVTALALLGFVVQVIINPIQKTLKSWTINKFHPWFYRLLMPLVVLLFVAIFRRIGDYGVTEKRYFVLAIALWILGITVYLLLSKKKSLKILPISLFILAMISSFGPWGVFNISKNSQIQQFEKVYATVIENDKKATMGQYEQLKSILYYLDDRESVFELDHITGISISIKGVFKDTVVADNTSEVYEWFDTQKALDSLGIAVDQEELEKNSPYGVFYTYDPNNIITNYDIEGYQHLAVIDLSEHTNTKNMKINMYKVFYDSRKLALVLSKKADTLEIPLREKLIELTAYGPELYKVTQKDMTLEAENDSISIKIVFTGLRFNVKQDSMNISYSNSMLLLKQK